MKKLLSLAIIASMALVSCSKAENPEVTGDKPDKEIKLNAGITASTKAAYDKDDAVSAVQFLREDDASSTVDDIDFSGATLITGDIAEDGSISFGSVQNYDKTADKYAWFVGYFPELTNGTAGTWTIDGKTDIMTTAAPVNAGKYSVPVSGATLALGHRLAQLFVKCEAASEISLEVAKAAWGEITKIEVVGVNNVATYTKGTAAVAFSGSGDIALLKADMNTEFANTSIAANGADTPVAGAMLAPGTTSVTLKVTTKIGEKEKVSTVSNIALTSFAASTKNTITLYFGAPDVAIGTKATIGKWETGGTGSGEVK